MSVDPKVPEKVGRYEILGFLAAGGMAEVLLGRLRGPSGFERPVVIKRILPHLVRQRAFVDMFLDEARIVASINHPNVVAVHELGMAGDELFLVMEYLEGESTWGLMRRLVASSSSLHPDIAAYIVAEAAAGIHAAHELISHDGQTRGLIHRDVSPQNIFVTYGGAVKVLDFGIAKAAGRITQTEAGQIKGKLEYMAPEQVKSKPIDRRVDVFALGVVLFELLTGRRLFKRESPAGTVRAICDEPIPTPSSVRPELGGTFDAILARALAREPADRYATAADLRRDLRCAMRERAADEMLAALMAGLFADRIEAKTEMLRRAQLGSLVTPVPASETEETIDIDIPNVSEGTVGATSSRVTPARSLRWPWLGAAAIVAGVAVLTAWQMRPKPAVTTEDRPPTSVTVHIETWPNAARVTIDDIDRGTTPLDLNVPRSSTPLVVRIDRDGSVPLVQELIPTSDQKLVLTLQPSMSSASGSSAGSALTLPAQSAVKPNVPVPPSARPSSIKKFTPKPWD
jgi:serine/threonine-protein kinase